MPVFVAVILGTLSAIAVTVLCYIFIMPEKKREKLSGFFGFLSDLFNFKYLVLEKALKALYVFETAFCICGGFFMLMAGYNGWGGFVSMWYYGLALIFVGPIVTRLVYEVFMLFILLVQNTMDINRKMKGGAKKEQPQFIDDAEPEPARTVQAPAPAPAAEPEPTPAAEPAKEPDYKFCAYCGTKYDANQGGCPNGCGK